MKSSCSDQFNIRHQMPRRIVDNARMWSRPPATALVEQHNAINIRVKIPPHRRAAPATWPTVQNDNRYPFRISSLFHINGMTIAHIKHPLIKRINAGVQMRNCALLLQDLVHIRPI